MASINLVVPSWKYWVDPLKLQPLWELYYATLLRETFPNHDVGVIDFRVSEAQEPEFVPSGGDIYVYWINKSADAFEIYEIVSKLRKQYPKAIHIAGGTHVDHLPDQCAQHFESILNGTAEDAMVRAVTDAIEARPMEKYYASTVRCHFKAYPIAQRDFISHDSIVNRKHFHKYGAVTGTSAYFSRGCGFKCRFCVYNSPPAFEYRTGEQITAEIEYLKAKYGVEGINLRDEVCIPVNRRVAIDYLEAIGRGNIVWRGQSIPLGSEELIKLAAETGLQELALGLESLDSDKVLTIANKPSKSIDTNRSYIEILKKYGIRVKICLIFGLPGESRHVLKRTIKYLEEIEPDYVAVSGFDPVPGSPFYREPEKFGIKKIDDDLSKHAHLLFRFGNEEKVGIPFEYEKNTPWGPGMSRKEIVHNIKEIQAWLRDRNMTY